MVRCSNSVWILWSADFSRRPCSSESKESLTRETEGKQRMRGDRGGSVISVAESMSRRSPRSSVRSHSHQTQRKLYSDERDLREHLERRAQQAIYDENSVRRKLYSTDCNTEIQSSGRRNSEYALHESQRELESQRQQLLMANHWANKLNVKEYICAANWRWEVIFIGNATREVAKEVKNWKDDAVKRKTQQDNKSWKNVMHSKIRIHCEIRFEDYNNDENLFRIQEFFKILTHRAVMAVLTFLIKLVLPRVPESQAAIQERRELHELIWVLLEMFMIANLHDVILTKYVTIRRIWQNHREVWGGKELRNVEVQNHYNPYLYLVVRRKQVRMVWTGDAVLRLWQTMPRVSGLLL